LTQGVTDGAVHGLRAKDEHNASTVTREERLACFEAQLIMVNEHSKGLSLGEGTYQGP
jgi:hypothetical protein